MQKLLECQGCGRLHTSEPWKECPACGHTNQQIVQDDFLITLYKSLDELGLTPANVKRERKVFLPVMLQAMETMISFN
jgi:hypothetical protein